MSEKVLLTGASGFIAKHTLLQLLFEGYSVRGTVRSLAKGEAIRKDLAGHLDEDALSRLEFAEADLNSSKGWDQACIGCGAVVHMASPFPLASPRHEDELIVPARDGTLRVLKAAKAAGVGRVVLTSSFAAVGYGLARGETGTIREDRWTDVSSADNSAYTKSKTVAEKAAWDFLEKDGAGMELVALNPTLVLGPLLAKADLGASVTLIAKMMKGEFPGYPRMGFGVVDVRDVAQYHAKAVSQPGVAGMRFILSNDFMGLGDVVRILKDYVGPAYRKKLPKFGLPDIMVRLAALADRDVRDNLFELGKVRSLDGSKAPAMFGITPRTSKTAITDCADSLISHGLV